MKLIDLHEAKTKAEKPFMEQLLDELEKSAAGPDFDVQDSRGGNGKNTEVFVSYSGWDAMLEITLKKNSVKCVIKHSEQNRGDSDEEDDATFPMESAKNVAMNIGEWVGTFMHNLGDYDQDDDE